MTIGYFIIGVLVIRQIFKRNLLMRCPSCKRFGSMMPTDSNQFILDENNHILDAEQLASNASNDSFYKCKHCQHISQMH